jgi:hypothetical protein
LQKGRRVRVESDALKFLHGDESAERNVLRGVLIKVMKSAGAFDATAGREKIDSGPTRVYVARASTESN